MWDFNPTHTQLLLRSPENAPLGHTHNIDIHFKNVTYVSVPWMMKGITLAVAENSQKLSICNDCQRLPRIPGDLKAYVIQPMEMDYVVITG